MPHSYLGVASLKASITIGDAADDARLRSVLEAASQTIDDECDRTFRVHLGTLYPTYHDGRLLLPADLLAVTTLKTDGDGDRVYEQTWTPTDYDLLPVDAPGHRMPYWEIAVAPNGAFAFPWDARRGVELVGKLGYWEDLLLLAATTAEALDASETAVDLTGVSEIEVGQTVLVDAEQMYVTGLAGTTAAVERGVNGTTAAAHLIGAAVSLYRYPAPIVEATRLQAARLFQRVHAPFGLTGSAELGTTAVISRIDPDVKQLIQHYRSGIGMVA